MSRTFRFFVSSEQLKSRRLSLESGEAHHALHVARVRVGECVEVFDGAGTVAQCEVRETNRRSVSLEVLTSTREAPPTQQLTLCVAYPNRERTLERIIESCVPLGVTDFVVFESDHSARNLVLSPKWERWAMEACKQCLRAWAPRFGVAPNLEEALSARRDGLLLLLDPESDEVRLPSEAQSARACVCVVGPEGGLSEREQRIAAAHGASRIGLGKNILRTELACSTVVALVGYLRRTSEAGTSSRDG